MTRSNRREVEGVVTSDKMDKSVVVRVERLVKHPLYKKYIRRRTKLMAHDESNVARIGDRVQLTETRPLSKNKSWRVVRVVGEGGGAPVEAPEPTVEMAQEVDESVAEESIEEPTQEESKETESESQS